MQDYNARIELNQEDHNDFPFFSPESHSMNVGVAIKTNSPAAALVFNHLFFWLKINKQKNSNYIEERTWMYQSIPQIACHFGYLSEQQVKDALNILVSHGYILKDNFNQNKFDKTKWYALANESWLECPKKMFSKGSADQIGMFHRPDRHVPQTRSTPYIDKDNKTDDKQITNTPDPSSRQVKRPDDKPRQAEVGVVDSIQKIKKCFGQSKNVYMTEDEHKKLLEVMGVTERDDWIEIIDTERGKVGPQAFDKKYKSHYHTILSWRRRRSQNTPGQPDKSHLSPRRRNSTSAFETKPDDWTPDYITQTDRPDELG